MDQPVQGQYKILQKLGAGGMGTVYLAIDSQLKRKVAIKLLHADFTHEQSAVKRFLREIEITAKLDHPHIVKIYHTFLQEEVPQLIMEFIEGKPLMDYINNVNVTLPVKLKIMQKIALALDYAHKKKIIHRDIKPSNIMVRNNGEPVLMDFGIAKVTKVEDKSLTRSGEIVGTLQYMSPEQATGAKRDVDYRTDIYSLGAVMYHILTGKMPLTAPSFMDMLDKISNEDPIPLRAWNPQVPMAVENICLKAMAKDKEKRYETARSLAADIENFLEGKKIAASSFAQKQKWIKVSRKIGVLSLSFLVIALLIGIFAYFIVPHIIRSRHEQQLLEDLSSYYQEAHTLMQSDNIEKKQSAYQKLLHAWNIGRQENDTQIHKPLLQNIFSLLCQTGYDLSIYWWPQDQDKSIFYFVSLQNILSGLKNSPDEAEKLIVIDAHLAYLRKDYTAFQKCLLDLLDKLKRKEVLAIRYSEVVLLQAQIQYESQNYSEAIHWLQLIPQNKHQQETLYYQGMCQYHLKKFQAAEELLLAAYQWQDMNTRHTYFQYDLVLYLADSISQQFIYQQIPIPRYQPILLMLEELEKRTNDMPSEQLQHYLEIQARYNIEILAAHPERSAELGQKVLDLANRSLQDDPLKASSYLQRGFAYRYLGKFSQAWEDYDYAFQLDPHQLESVNQLWTIFPYCMDATDDYVEKFNSMVCRWGIRGQILALDVCQEDFLLLRQQYYEATKNLAHTPFNQTNFDKFYRNLSLPWKDMKNLAKSALVVMIPHEETLKALDQAVQIQDVEVAHDASAVQEVKDMIQQHQIQEEQIYWCYFISRVNYQGLIPLTTLGYVQKQESLLKFLRQGILERPTAPTPETQKNWLLLQFLAARILAQLTFYHQEYGRAFLYSLMNDTNQSVELRIIVAKALHDAGLNYLDYGFLQSYIQQRKAEYREKFLDLQVALILMSSREDHRRLLIELINTTPHPVVPLLVYYQLPSSEAEFLKDQLEPRCQQALKSEDVYEKMVAVLNCKVIERYRMKRKDPKRNIIDIPQTLLHAIRQHQYPMIQKAALYNLMMMRNCVNQECMKELERLLSHYNPELRLFSISVLAGFSHPSVLKLVFQENSTFTDQIAFFDGMGRGDKSSNALERFLIEGARFLMQSQNAASLGLGYCMVCQFLSHLQTNISEEQLKFTESQIQILSLRYLQRKDPLLLFWTLTGMTRLDNITTLNIKAVQKIQQDLTVPIHIRKMAMSVLLYASVKKGNREHQILFEQIIAEIQKNLQDPDELWQAILLGYKQAMRNNHSDIRPNYTVIGEADAYQLWDYYLIRFQRNIIDPEICSCCQTSLENILTLLEVFPQRNPKQQEEWVKAIYFLATLHLQSDRPQVARALLEKSDRYLSDIRLSELWLRIQPTDLSKIIQYWQNISTASSYERACLLRFQASNALEKQDYKQSDDLFLQQYISAPSDPLSLILIAENMLEQKKFMHANSIVDHTIYLCMHKSRAYWTKIRICAIQKDHAGTYQAIRDNLANFRAPYPIRPNDLENPIFAGMDHGSINYYLALWAADRYAHAEVVVWMQNALKYKAPIPPEFQAGGYYGNSFQRCGDRAEFRKAWHQLQQLTKP